MSLLLSYLPSSWLVISHPSYLSLNVYPHPPQHLAKKNVKFLNSYCLWSLTLRLPTHPPLKDYIHILRLVDRSVSLYTFHSIWHVAISQLILVVQIDVLNKDFILSFSTFQKGRVYFIWNSILFHDSYEFFLNRWDKSTNLQVHQGKLIGCSFRLRRGPMINIELFYIAVAKRGVKETGWLDGNLGGNRDEVWELRQITLTLNFLFWEMGKNNPIIGLRCGLNKTP